MKRPATALVLLVLLAPLSSAHVPPAPYPGCQTPADMMYHEYLPALRDDTFTGGPIDGNVADCGGGDEPDCKSWLRRMGEKVLGFLERVWDRFLNALEQAAGELIHEAVDNICERAFEIVRTAPVADFDGELEAGVARVWLAYGNDVDACYDSRTIAHHTGAIRAEDIRGYGPAFLVTADHSLLPLDGPDCGDGFLNPCASPPQPAADPFPVNLIKDQTAGILYHLTEAPGTTCDPLDAVARVESAAQATLWTPTFGPGADGTYTVLLLDDIENLRLLNGGHVWTS